MDASWISAGVAVAAMAITYLRNDRSHSQRDGAIDTTLESHDKQLGAHALELDGVKERLTFHGERITRVETKLHVNGSGGTK